MLSIVCYPIGNSENELQSTYYLDCSSFSLLYVCIPNDGYKAEWIGITFMNDNMFSLMSIILHRDMCTKCAEDPFHMGIILSYQKASFIMGTFSDP